MHKDHGEADRHSRGPGLRAREGHHGEADGGREEVSADQRSWLRRLRLRTIPIDVAKGMNPAAPRCVGQGFTSAKPMLSARGNRTTPFGCPIR
jgi:hypothetical protein